MKLSVWIMGISLMATMIAATGCGQNRWHPTDPRVDTPSTENLTIDDRWSADLGTTVTASAL